MKFKAISPNDLDKNLKATIQSTGKLGFSAEASKKIGLDDYKGVLLGIDEEDAEGGTLYAKFEKEGSDNRFKVIKSGKYFYINTTKAFFDLCKIDYKANTVIFDITETAVEEEKYYKFSKRDPKSKRKKSDSE